MEKQSLVLKLNNVLSNLNKIRELLQHDDDSQFQKIMTILDELLQKWPKEISEHVKELETEFFHILNENQKLQNNLQCAQRNYKSLYNDCYKMKETATSLRSCLICAKDKEQRLTNECHKVKNEMKKLQSDLQNAKEEEQRLYYEHQKVLNEMTKLQSDVQEKTQRLHNQQESVTSPSQLSLVGIIHGHLPIDAEQGEKGEAKDKFSGFFRNSIEPLLDAMEECKVSETESSAIACQIFQLTYNHCKEVLVERMKNQLLLLFQRSEVISEEERKRIEYTTMAFSLLCHGANVHQLKMKEDQTLSKKIREDVEKYSILQHKPTIQQELDKLLTSAIETAQSLISCVPPMVVDCLPYPDVASKAYPTLQGDPTNYVTTQPALFFSYEAGGDKINGKCELLLPESRCFSRNWSDKEDGVQVSKKKPEGMIREMQIRFPQRRGCYSNECSSRKISKNLKFNVEPANQQMRKRSHASEKQQTTYVLHDFPHPFPPYSYSTYNFHKGTSL